LIGASAAICASCAALAVACAVHAVRAHQDSTTPVLARARADICPSVGLGKRRQEVDGLSAASARSSCRRPFGVAQNHPLWVSRIIKSRFQHIVCFMLTDLRGATFIDRVRLSSRRGLQGSRRYTPFVCAAVTADAARARGWSSGLSEGPRLSVKASPASGPRATA